MADLQVEPVVAPLAAEVDPADVGLDAHRLQRIERHFHRYVEDGRLAGWMTVIAREGKVAYVAIDGDRDREAGLPVDLDTVWRIFSMTKPVTSVAAMMLHEEGLFELDDPVSKFIPSFGDARVWRGGTIMKPLTDPIVEPMRVWNLLTHTSGLTYGFHYSHAVDALYRLAGYEWGSPPGLDLAAVCDAYAGLPLLFQPGAEWNYSVSTDVLGRVVEVIAGQPLDQVFADRIFTPLGMSHTGFAAAADDLPNLARLYVRDPATGRAKLNEQMDVVGRHVPACLSGGGGLVSTAGDYHRFTQMLLDRGELDGVRLLGSRTVDLMATNHLPGNADLQAFGRPLYAETPFSGVGFGLGLSVTLDPIPAHHGSSVGEFGWGGAASTAFWVDPAERMTAMFFTQLLPSGTYPLRSQLHQLVRQALVD